MWTDVVDLREFYARRMGRTAQRMIRRQLRAFWPDLTGLRVLGVGFATPYLSVYRSEAERVMAAMPAGQGVLHWPLGERGLTMLADETDLPLPDLSVDRVLIVHALECAEQVRPMLREVWRVLADSGRMIVVVPNRRGLWARVDTTPFGHGRPYSRGQLARVLRDSLFTPLDWDHALYMPPLNLQILLRSSVAWERLGTVLWPAFSGVLIVEATKQIYAATPDGAAERVRARLSPVPNAVSPRSRSRAV